MNQNGIFAKADFWEKTMKWCFVTATAILSTALYGRGPTILFIIGGAVLFIGFIAGCISLNIDISHRGET